MTSSNLPQVPGVIKDSVQAEPAVTARLDNIEKMVESLTKGFKEIKSTKQNQWPAIQVNGVPAHVQAGHSQANGQELGAVPRRETGAVSAATRERSPSLKRSAEDAQLENVPGAAGQPKEASWSQVVGRNQGQGRRQRPVQYGTSKVHVAGGEARPYDVVVGNTNPGSTDEIIKTVLKNISENMPEELKLETPSEISEVE